MTNQLDGLAEPASTLIPVSLLTKEVQAPDHATRQEVHQHLLERLNGPSPEAA